MNNEIERINYNGYEIVIYPDCDADSPRNWDNLGTMYCHYRGYNLGDKDMYDEFTDSYTYLEYIQSKEIAVCLPLYLLDHSGLWIRTGRFAEDSGGWDTSYIGHIIVTKKQLKKEYNIKRINKKILQQAKDILQSEVSTYNDYLSGAIYGYIVKDSDDNDLDSCWGFYGHDYKESGLLEYAENSIDCHIQQLKKQKADTLKKYIKNKVPLEIRQLNL